MLDDGFSLNQFKIFLQHPATLTCCNVVKNNNIVTRNSASTILFNVVDSEVDSYEQYGRYNIDSVVMQAHNFCQWTKLSTAQQLRL